MLTCQTFYTDWQLFQNEPIKLLVLYLSYWWFVASVCRGITNIDYTNNASINALQIPCFTLQVL